MSALAPPPWFIDEREELRHFAGRDTLLISCHEPGDATPSIVAVATRGYEDGPSWTNARLIAAAPDLLRVAELLVDWLDEKPGGRALCDMALAAIAKAKGE